MRSIFPKNPLLLFIMVAFIATLLPGAARPQFMTVYPVVEREVRHQKGTLSLNVFKVDNFSGSSQHWRMLEQQLKPLRETDTDLLLVFYYRSEAMLPDYQRYIDEFQGKEKILRQDIEPLIEQIDDKCVLFYYCMGKKGAFLQNPVTKKAELEQLLKLLDRQ